MWFTNVNERGEVEKHPDRMENNRIPNLVNQCKPRGISVIDLRSVQRKYGKTGLLADIYSVKGMMKKKNFLILHVWNFFNHV